MCQILQKGNSLPDKKNESKTTPPTVITLTLPTPEGGGIAPEQPHSKKLLDQVRDALGDSPPEMPSSLVITHNSNVKLFDVEIAR